VNAYDVLSTLSTKDAVRVAGLGFLVLLLRVVTLPLVLVLLLAERAVRALSDAAATVPGPTVYATTTAAYNAGSAR
jgi:hypothetical protein